MMRLYTVLSYIINYMTIFGYYLRPDLRNIVIKLIFRINRLATAQLTKQNSSKIGKLPESSQARKKQHSVLPRRRVASKFKAFANANRVIIPAHYHYERAIKILLCLRRATAARISYKTRARAAA